MLIGKWTRIRNLCWVHSSTAIRTFKIMFSVPFVRHDLEWGRFTFRSHQNTMLSTSFYLLNSTEICHPRWLYTVSRCALKPPRSLHHRRMLATVTSRTPILQQPFSGFPVCYIVSPWPRLETGERVDWWLLVWRCASVSDEESCRVFINGSNSTCWNSMLPTTVLSRYLSQSLRSLSLQYCCEFPVCHCLWCFLGFLPPGNGPTFTVASGLALQGFSCQPQRK